MNKTLNKTSKPCTRQAGGKGVTARRSPQRLSATPAVVAAAVVGVATVMAAAVTGIFGMVHPTPATNTSPVSTPPPATNLPSSLIPRDSTEFVKDITFPDNSPVKPGQRFIKKWEIKNIGKVRWVGRDLIPDGFATGTCAYPSRVLVPTTDPGHSVVISVPVTAPSTPQLCMVTWKMVSPAGVLYFPGYGGIWFEVKVISSIL